MSLSDLKKNAANRANKKAKVNVDDFIADADNYALGKSSLLKDADIKTGLAAKAAKKKASYPSFRHCTFTLDPQSIGDLANHAQSHSQAKSKMVRILIDHFEQLSPEQQQAIIDASNSK